MGNIIEYEIENKEYKQLLEIIQDLSDKHDYGLKKLEEKINHNLDLFSHRIESLLFQINSTTQLQDLKNTVDALKAERKMIEKAHKNFGEYMSTVKFKSENAFECKYKEPSYFDKQEQKKCMMYEKLCSDDD